MRFKTYRPHLSTAHDARAVRTRTALRSALLSLLETSPLDQVSIRDIAAKASTSYTTFFRHYKTKEALLDDLAAEEIRRLLALALPIVDSKSIEHASEALFVYVGKNRDLWSALLTGGAADALRTELLGNALKVAASRDDPGSWPPADIATLLLVSGTFEILTWWLRQAKPLAARKVAEIHCRFVIKPILSGRTLNPGAKEAPPTKR